VWWNWSLDDRPNHTPTRLARTLATQERAGWPDVHERGAARPVPVAHYPLGTILRMGTGSAVSCCAGCCLRWGAAVTLVGRSGRTTANPRTGSPWRSAPASCRSRSSSSR